MTEITLILFDIDGTLLDMRGAGRKAFAKAIEHVLGGQDNLDYINFAGNTDLNVLRQVAAHRNLVLGEDRVRAVFTRAPIELEAAARGAELILYPGVRPLLEALASDERALLGLVTGNIEACAWVKLRQFDLHGHFMLGGFGDHDADRVEIARRALAAARQTVGAGKRIGPLFLVGDTPFDIAAARGIGAQAVAVATGKFGVEELRHAGADTVLADLSDTPAVLQLLGLRADGV